MLGRLFGKRFNATSRYSACGIMQSTIGWLLQCGSLRSTQLIEHVFSTASGWFIERSVLKLFADLWKPVIAPDYAELAGRAGRSYVSTGCYQGIELPMPMA